MARGRMREAVPSVIIYTTKQCPFCLRAKAFLDARGVSDEERFIARTDHDGRERLVAATGGYTFPQIIVDNRTIGGWDDLAALDGRGELGVLLNPPLPTASPAAGRGASGAGGERRDERRRLSDSGLHCKPMRSLARVP